MKKYLYTIFFIFFLMGCENEKRKFAFEGIDYSSSDGWVYVKSIKIDSMGNTFLLREHYNGEKEYSSFKLATNSLDYLSILVENVNFNKLDTFYQVPCQDCGFFNMIINESPPKKYKIFVDDLNNEDERLKNLMILSNFLETLVKDSLKKYDNLIFESKTKDFIYNNK